MLYVIKANLSWLHFLNIMPSFKRYRRKRKTHRKHPYKEQESEPDPADPSSYEITKVNVHEEKIPQCPAAEAGILPKHPFRMYVVGASGSGKSNFILNLLTRDNMYKDYFDCILVISPTAVQLDPNYEVLNLPDEHYFQPEEEVLERIMEVQKEEVEEKGKAKCDKLLIVLDDIISYKDFVKSPILLKFAVMSRHWNISMMILSQAYHRIPKPIRLQMSSVVFFKGSNKELEVLSEDFGAPGMSSWRFMNGITYATMEKYNFFFIDLHTAIEDGRYRKNLTEHLFTKSARRGFKQFGYQEEEKTNENPQDPQQPSAENNFGFEQQHHPYFNKFKQ